MPIEEKCFNTCYIFYTLMTKFDMDFERYKTDISFQYSCNMCIIQIGELADRVSEENSRKVAKSMITDNK